VNVLAALALGWLIGDRIAFKREFRRLEKFCVTSVFGRGNMRNTRAKVWSTRSMRFSADKPYESNDGMTYKETIKEGKFDI
jgi:hypothetical protein